MLCWVRLGYVRLVQTRLGLDKLVYVMLGQARLGQTGICYVVLCQAMLGQVMLIQARLDLDRLGYVMLCYARLGQVRLAQIMLTVLLHSVWDNLHQVITVVYIRQSRYYLNALLVGDHRLPYYSYVSKIVLKLLAFLLHFFSFCQLSAKIIINSSAFFQIRRNASSSIILTLDCVKLRQFGKFHSICQCVPVQ